VKVRVVKLRNAKSSHPHTHIIARGVTHDGKGLNIAGEYISRGIRGRLEEELTRELGWKSELIDLRAGSAASTFGQYSPLNRHILIGRMKHLEKMGLAQSKYEGLWRVEKRGLGGRKRQ